jgi:hypothetical protein
MQLIQEALPKPRFTNQTRWMENHLDAVWEVICADFMPDETFTRKDVEAALIREFAWADRTAKNYTSACLAYLVNLEEGGLFKVQGKRYRFHDREGK